MGIEPGDRAVLVTRRPRLLARLNLAAFVRKLASRRGGNQGDSTQYSKWF